MKGSVLHWTNVFYCSNLLFTAKLSVKFWGLQARNNRLTEIIFLRPSDQSADLLQMLGYLFSASFCLILKIIPQATSLLLAARIITVTHTASTLLIVASRTVATIFATEGELSFVLFVVVVPRSPKL